MINSKTLSLLAILMIALLPSCSQQSSTDENGPGGTVQQFYLHLNAQDFESARALYSAEALSFLDDPELSTPEAYRNWAQSHTHEGSIESVTILGTDSAEGEEKVVVEYQINYDDGTTATHEVVLTQEAGLWKLGLLG